MPKRKRSSAASKFRIERSSTRFASNDSDSDSDSDAALMLDNMKHNIRVIDNTVYFNDAITHETVFRLNFTLRKLEKSILARSACLADLLGAEPEAAGKFAATTPVHLHVTSYGGLIDAAFSAVDCIKGLKVPVVTVVDGYVASAGTLITLAGTKRQMLPNAKLLIHQLRTGMWGKFAELTEQYDNSKKTMDHLSAFYVAHTKIKRKRLDKLLKKDVDWDATECLAHGVIDEIVSPSGPGAGGTGAGGASQGDSDDE